MEEGSWVARHLIQRQGELQILLVEGRRGWGFTAQAHPALNIRVISPLFNMFPSLFSILVLPILVTNRVSCYLCVIPGGNGCRQGGTAVSAGGGGGYYGGGGG